MTNDAVVVVVLSPQREDSDKIGELRYFPPNGTFNLMYYPYYGKKAQVRHGRISKQQFEIKVYLNKSVPSVSQVNYSQPLVAVKFLNITANQDVNIECKINANNIPIGSDRDKFAGRVSFKLRINSAN